ncbi:glucans biosynthesis glucosyltransferase MdoH [Rhizorhabdus dicambivorans]|uniref:Glucans biosynthesis glucosyltransferase H n=2 Tax=Rhizorhabdus dicambivorans TaxID=1850238 RepID=A0A2A4FXK2_9SPHN|nr:glucans biosynthesis glucosyltransferase MdoH [Rhizorhabdus dicambivorans]PCE42920.1 glucans biosynthesis glucosyltransferase MdoH [Rhizorhabdus dicambivorans]
MGAPGADLPPEAPLAMPVQDLSRLPANVQAEPVGYVGPLFQRRLFLIVGSFLFGLLAAQEMFTPLQSDGIDWIDAGFFLLFFGLFAWIAFGFLNAVAGLFVLLGRGPAPAVAPGRLTRPRGRTAVLMPIYNEDIAAVSRRLAAMTDSVDRVGAADRFDFFILSDSHERNHAAEYLAFRRLREASRARLFYRRRPRNIARKPGNIAEWVQRFGGAYDYMLVLDADSLMSGAAMVRLATAIEARPNIGLLQTVPQLINGQTMFARWHQFASAVYGPVASAGLRWWSGTEATFWGHNAIVRVRAFAESCGLPELSEDGLLGGHIMSHDMVEAALLRRRGWAVHMVALPDGSYEEFPPTMIDHSVRDRRWCQGNLQHLRLLGTAGLHWVSRLQLFMGASAYLTSPLWLLLLGAAIFEQLRANFDGYVLISSGWLLGLTVLMLIGPKAAALIALSQDRPLVRQLGGWPSIARGTLLEILTSIVTAPVIMLTQTMAIVDILRGRQSGWLPQRREVEGLDLAEVTRFYRWHIALGVAMMAAIGLGIDGTIWSLPVALGLLLTPLTVWLTARADVGEWLVRRGWFVSPADQRRFEEGPEDAAVEPLLEPSFVIARGR